MFVFEVLLRVVVILSQKSRDSTQKPWDEGERCMAQIAAESSALSADCPICGSTDHQVVHAMCTIDSPIAVPGAILRCRTCGMWFKAASLDSIEQAYSPPYAENASLAHYMNSTMAHAFFHKVLKRVNCQTGSAHPVLLDIGCGTGTMLEEAQALGYAPEGIEICHGLADVARKKGFLIHHGNAMELDEIEKYDVVTAMDIIEHIMSPLTLLRVVNQSLKPGGELVVYTPNHRSAIVFLARALARGGVDFAFRNIFGDNHVCFFDDHTLTTALVSTGFEVRTMRKFPYDPQRPGMRISPAKLCIIRAVEELGRPFGAVFRMIAFAQKVCLQ